MTHRTRDFRVRQQTQLSNALRAHLAEFGVVAPKGGHNVARLLALAEQTALPEAAVWSIRSLVDPPSGRSAVWSIRSLVDPQSGRSAVWSIRSLADPQSGRSAVWPIRSATPTPESKQLCRTSARRVTWPRPHGTDHLGPDQDRRKLPRPDGLIQVPAPSRGHPQWEGAACGPSRRCEHRLPGNGWQTDGKRMRIPRSDRSADFQRAPLIGTRSTRTSLRGRSVHHGAQIENCIRTPDTWPQPTRRQSSTKTLATQEPSIHGPRTMARAEPDVLADLCWPT